MLGRGGNRGEHEYGEGEEIGSTDVQQIPMLKRQASYIECTRMVIVAVTII